MVPRKVAQGVTQKLTREENVQWSIAPPGGVLMSDQLFCCLVTKSCLTLLQPSGL